jgi:hypothetical protein
MEGIIVVHSVQSRTQTLASEGVDMESRRFRRLASAWRRFHFVGRGRLSLSGVSLSRDEQSYFSMLSATRLTLLFCGGYSGVEEVDMERGSCCDFGLH